MQLLRHRRALLLDGWGGKSLRRGNSAGAIGSHVGEPPPPHQPDRPINLFSTPRAKNFHHVPLPMASRLRGFLAIGKVHQARRSLDNANTAERAPTHAILDGLTSHAEMNCRSTRRDDRLRNRTSSHRIKKLLHCLELLPTFSHCNLPNPACRGNRFQQVTDRPTKYADACQHRAPLGRNRRPRPLGQ